MIYRNLRDFLEILKEKNDLKIIDCPVSNYLEITEIHRRVLESGGEALLFNNVASYNVPVLVNLFGTKERIALAMGTDVAGLRDIGKMLAFMRQPKPPRGWQEITEIMPMAKKIFSMTPKNVKKAPCQEIILRGDEIDLSKLPIQYCWPDEPSPLITWPLVVTKNSDDEKIDDYNLGIYRMQVVGKNKTLMRWLKHRGGAQHHANWQKKQENNSSRKMPAAAVIGCDPATILAAVTPVPETISEYQFSGLLRGSKLELVDCVSIPLKVPAQAEIVLEGYVSLDDYMDEGPYGDHTGYYNSVEKFPVFEVTAITMRKDPIYLSTYTGRPPDEPAILGEALNELFIPLIQQQFPEIVDFWLPPEGCSYRIAVISIKKAYAGHAKRIMMGAWSYLRQFLYTKFVIIVDEEINCRDWKDVMWAMSTRMDPARDITVIENTPIDYLDFASIESGLGGKIGFDATNKLYPESKREWGKEIYMSQDIIDLVNSKWKDYGFK
jgi:4-hydroxy-3-polyprenylbenzoate decarboxylase